jgi:hypothetical protein
MLCMERTDGLWTVHHVEGVMVASAFRNLIKAYLCGLQLIRQITWLLPLLSFHGIEILSGLIVASFRVNSFSTFDRSFSSFDLPMTGTLWTTRMRLKPSSSRGGQA